MKVEFRIRSETSYNGEAMCLCTTDDRELTVANLIPNGVGYRRFSPEEQSAIVRAVLERLDGIEIEIPDAPDEYQSKPPRWVDTGGGGSTARVSRTPAGNPGEVRAPAGAKFLPNGEIEVPPRRPDETPEQKKFRRACRKARNAIRDGGTLVQ